MTIEITKPELEALIQRRLESGAFQSVEELIEDALSYRNEDEVWVAENRDEIEAQLAEGVAQLDRGEGLTSDAFQAQLRERKAAWLA